MSVPKALEHLGDAETTLMSFMQQIVEAGDDDDKQPNIFAVVAAVLRSISRAAGALEED